MSWQRKTCLAHLTIIIVPDIGIQKRFWFSAFGYIDIITKAGKVWNKVPYPLLILPNANLSYTIQPEAYTNMNAMEFISDEYASWDLTYYMNGNLLNRLPLIKKLKAREVFCFPVVYGDHLTEKNNLRMEGTGYIFSQRVHIHWERLLIWKQVWALRISLSSFALICLAINYRNHPDIQTKGIRCTMRLSF